MSCIFCKIAAGEIPSNKVYEDDKILVFHDISPEAPKHILVIPKEHIASANDLNEENVQVLTHIFLKIKDIAKEMGFAESGYRIVNNCGKDGAQSVEHLHFHVLAGKPMGWPPYQEI